jgi:hypothetical protein
LLEEIKKKKLNTVTMDRKTEEEKQKREKDQEAKKE